MKHSILILSLTLILLIPDYSCSKEEICTCSIQHPEENIPWLNDFLDNSTYANVYKLEVNGQDYIICTSVPGLDAVSLVFDCTGNLLCKSGANYEGENTCLYLSSSWDSIYQKRILIYKKRQ
jgi:hypothetical protein